MDWTPELHKKFVKAVEQLGIDRAIPSKILELMKADGLTRHNVASHLQVSRLAIHVCHGSKYAKLLCVFFIKDKPLLPGTNKLVIDAEISYAKTTHLAKGR